MQLWRQLVVEIQRQLWDRLLRLSALDQRRLWAMMSLMRWLPLLMHLQ
jgi:hypothetical protein